MQSSLELIESIVADDEKRTAETYRFMEEQRIKKALAPAQWEELKSDLQSQCDAIGASSGLKLMLVEEGINKATLRNLRNGSSASLSYDLDEQMSR